MTTGLRSIDIVMPQQVQLIEDEQQACRVAAAVNAIKLLDVVHVFPARAT
jgi:hypothetical protein